MREGGGGGGGGDGDGGGGGGRLLGHVTPNSRRRTENSSQKSQ